LVALGVTWLAAARPAWADDKAQCIASHEQAQILRRDGKFRASREQLVVCVSTCPEAARGPCDRWLSDLETSMPSVVFDARDPAGRHTLDVRVQVDGALLAERLDGKALAVDPGMRTFRFEFAGAEPIEMKIPILEGEKNRKLLVDFSGEAPSGSATEPPDTDPSSPGGRPVPALVFVVGIVGVVGIGSFVSLGLSGLSEENEIRGTGCKPNCSEDDVGAVRTRYAIGDVALGLGVASLGVAAVLFFTRPTVPASGARASPPARAPLRIEVRSAYAGGTVGVAGSF
jgi:hypothetical protein